MGPLTGGFIGGPPHWGAHRWAPSLGGSQVGPLTGGLTGGPPHWGVHRWAPSLGGFTGGPPHWGFTGGPPHWGFTGGPLTGFTSLDELSFSHCSCHFILSFFSPTRHSPLREAVPSFPVWLAFAGACLTTALSEVRDTFRAGVNPAPTHTHKLCSLLPMSMLQSVGAGPINEGVGLLQQPTPV